MKKHTMTVMALMAAIFYGGLTAHAYTPTLSARLEMGKKNYLMGVRSGNQGLVESAMMQVAKIKIAYPAFDITEIKSVLDSLSINAKIPSVRYRAYLASNVCDNPTWFAKENSDADVNDFFVSVESQLQGRILGSRTD